MIIACTSMRVGWLMCVWGGGGAERVWGSWCGGRPALGPVLWQRHQPWALSIVSVQPIIWAALRRGKAARTQPAPATNKALCYRDAPIDWPVIRIGRFFTWPARIGDQTHVLPIRSWSCYCQWRRQRRHSHTHTQSCVNVRMILICMAFSVNGDW